MRKIIRKTSVFPASKEVVFSLLQKLETLQYIAKPYATFENLGRDNAPIWEPGKAFAFRFKVFGLVPLGVHTIHVKEFCADAIYTNESNPFCPVWDHRIVLMEKDKTHTVYTDEVDEAAKMTTSHL